MDLIVGATGTLGGKVALDLAARGREVAALVRPETPARLARPHTDPATLEAAGVRLVPGDLADPARLREALTGVDRIVSTASASKRDADPGEVDGDGTIRLIDAARDVGVEQFVLVSALGADPDAPNPLFAAKGRSADHLRQSGLSWTVLAPAPFMEDWIGFVIGSQLAAGPRVTLVGDGRTPRGFVAEPDVARMAVAALGRDEARGATLPLIGDVASYRVVVAAFERATGRSIEVTTVPPGAEVPGLPPVISAIWAGLEQGPPATATTRDLGSRFGVDFTPVEAFVAGALAAPA